MLNINKKVNFLNKELICINHLIPAEDVTQSQSSQLFRYPVQNINNTLQRFLTSVKPIVSLDIYQNTINSIDNFSQPNGIGEYLQKLLKMYADNYENWLVDTNWWNNYKYLHNRKSIVTNTSPGINWPLKCFPTLNDWLNYAANMIEITLKYKRICDRNELPVERFGKYLLDMTQYENIFGTCRIPGISVDKLDMNPNSKHIVVVFRNVVSNKNLSAYLLYANFFTVL